MTEWDEAARNLTARGARGMSERTLSSLQATRRELGLEPVEVAEATGPQRETVVATDGSRALVSMAGTGEPVQTWVPNDELPDHLRQQVQDQIDAFMAEPTAEQEAAATRHNTVEVSQEESDALWASVEAGQEQEEPEGLTAEDELGDYERLYGTPTRTAEEEAARVEADQADPYRQAPKAPDRTAEEVERQQARTRELREEDDYACDF